MLLVWLSELIHIITFKGSILGGSKVVKTCQISSLSPFYSHTYDAGESGKKGESGEHIQALLHFYAQV